MNRYTRGAISLCVASMAAAASFIGGPAWAAGKEEAEAILDGRCGACHERTADGKFPRINDIRKTPEGWEMTIRRMKQWRKIELPENEERTLIKYLSDTQGLAPSEAAPFRAVLERRPGHVESADDADIAAFCARCHSYARIGLQRRDTAEWVKHVNMHLGQWPTIEYQASGRDREWWKVASTEIAAKLGQKWPYTTSAWTEWQSHQPVDLTGTWRVAGHRPGKGDYAGTLTVTRSGTDEYAVASHAAYADGTEVSGSGHSIVYTGHEWRGTAALGKERVHEIYEVSADGQSLQGRWFLDGESAIGGDLKAVRQGAPAILAVNPSFLKAGQTAELTIVGSGLSGKVDLGPGVQVQKVLRASDNAVTLVARVAKDAALGRHAVTIGGLTAADSLVVYDKVDAVKVEPAMAIARTGANGGPVPATPAQFEAVAYLRAPDGGEDIRIGVMPARWSTIGFDEVSVAAKDAHFSGRMGNDGLFLPASAGPNSARKGANNAGNMTVKAVVADGSRKVEGTGHLIVTVQRWNDALIR